EQGLLDRTLLVLASDHGEEFLEHGHMMHCRGIWSTLSHVPLIFWLPGAVDGRRVSAAVENLDIVPTILDYLGIPTDGYGFEGESLRPLAEGREATGRYAFADQGRYRSVDDGRFHLIYDGVEKSAVLFETAADPLEQHDLFAPDHPALAPLTAALDRWLSATGQALRFEDAFAAARAKEEELRALGYLQ
ncbi:MAG TPA: sulfatase-like hydrolase/transferase, partial [Chondromyces sp.]|nr:sulfatase-like hydrolase/transferase [Chondromyces sp.]